MKRRILIPTDDPDGHSVASHFGRAPYFAAVDLDEAGAVIEKTVHPNTGEHSGGRGHAHDNVMQLKPRVIIVYGMGPRGLMSFERQDIAVLRANSGLVDELVTAFIQNELEELTEGCSEAHHK
ncbi:MAG: NifB/NifX family molybdenum-iron cluster-binding protein [Candidatus Thorarchaeota archaeon]